MGLINYILDQNLSQRLTDKLTTPVERIAGVAPEGTYNHMFTSVSIPDTEILGNPADLDTMYIEPALVKFSKEINNMETLQCAKPEALERSTCLIFDTEGGVPVRFSAEHKGDQTNIILEVLGT